MKPITRETAKNTVAPTGESVSVATPPADFRLTDDAAEAFGAWLDIQLAHLEDRFSHFRTRGSLRASLRGDRSRG
jgi:hypothetical protein